MGIAFDASVKLVTSPWSATFYNLVDTAEKELLVVSPFVSSKPLKKIVEIIKDKQLLDNVHVDIVTNLAVGSLLSGSLDVAAILYLAQSTPSSTVT